MKLYDHPLYRADVSAVAALPLPWETLRDRSLLISGATGLIGRLLTDVLLLKNREGLGCVLYCLTRDPDAAVALFPADAAEYGLRLLACDVNRPLALPSTLRADYVLHLASNTHPRQYATLPVSTITTNLLGAMRLLDYARDVSAKRFLFASSNEIYGENRSDRDLFAEDDCGYLDCNTLRAGYAESKRCTEALCQAYRSEYGLGVVIARLTRSFGPTLRMDDSKAASQFLKKALAGEDVVLKSEGTQYYSYTYAPDAVSGLLTVLLLGVDGEAYNVADASCDVRLRSLAQMFADAAGTKLRFELPDTVEAAGFSRATKARLDGAKLRSLGWRPMYGLEAAVQRTCRILKDCD